MSRKERIEKAVREGVSEGVSEGARRERRSKEGKREELPEREGKRERGKNKRRERGKERGRGATAALATHVPPSLTAARSRSVSVAVLRRFAIVMSDDVTRSSVTGCESVRRSSKCVGSKTTATSSAVM